MLSEVSAIYFHILDYLLWCQQVGRVIKLHHFMLNTQIPMKFTSLKFVETMFTSWWYFHVYSIENFLVNTTHIIKISKDISFVITQI